MVAKKQKISKSAREKKTVPPEHRSRLWSIELSVGDYYSTDKFLPINEIRDRLKKAIQILGVREDPKEDGLYLVSSRLRLVYDNKKGGVL